MTTRGLIFVGNTWQDQRPFLTHGDRRNNHERTVSESFARWIVGALAIYLAFGVVVAIPFVVRGVNRIDPVARESTWGFRAIIFPGSVALWPLLLKRWVLGQTAPGERNAHRSAARRAG